MRTLGTVLAKTLLILLIEAFVAAAFGLLGIVCGMTDADAIRMAVGIGLCAVITDCLMAIFAVLLWDTFDHSPRQGW